MGTMFNESYGIFDPVSDPILGPECKPFVRDGEGYYPMMPGNSFFDPNDNRPLNEVILSFNMSSFGSEKRRKNIMRIFSIFNLNEEKIRSYLRKHSFYVVIAASITADANNGIGYRSFFLQIPNTYYYIDLFDLDGKNPCGRGKFDILSVKKLLNIIDFDCSSSLEEAIQQLRKQYNVLERRDLALSRNVTFCSAKGHNCVIYECKQRPLNIFKNEDTNELLLPVRGGYMRLIDYTSARYERLNFIGPSFNRRFFIPVGDVEKVAFYTTYSRKELKKIAKEQRTNI